jgi:predicted RNA-binding Zn ribbon-like protein
MSSQHATDVPHGHQVDLETGLDFVNTMEFSKGLPVEHLDSIQTALRWLFDHDLMHRDKLQAELARLGADEAAADRVLGRIRKVRMAMRELADATVERRPADGRQVDEVNRALRTPYTYYLVPGPDGVSMDHKHDGHPVDGALARLAESIAREVSQGHPERLRICANDECRWVFNDTSRTGKRKWCDMSTCGNRAKVARHRERRREAEAEAGDLAADIAHGADAGETPPQPSAA